MVVEDGPRLGDVASLQCGVRRARSALEFRSLCVCSSLPPLLSEQATALVRVGQDRRSATSTSGLVAPGLRDCGLCNQRLEEGRCGSGRSCPRGVNVHSGHAVKSRRCPHASSFTQCGHRESETITASVRRGSSPGPPRALGSTTRQTPTSSAALMKAGRAAANGAWNSEGSRTKIACSRALRRSAILASCS